METKKRRKPRVSRACEGCRSRKIRCSGGPVCDECRKYGENCVVRSQYRDKKEIQSDSNFLNNEAVEIPDYLSISRQNNNAEYFGSASNFSFVNQLNHLLRQLENSNGSKDIGLERFGFQPTILEPSGVDEFSIDKITSETVNKLLVAFLETWSVPIPFFRAHQLFELASDTWKNPSATPEDKALLYLVLSTGAATSYFDIDESSPKAFPVSKGFFDLAVRTVPTIFSQVSFEAVRILFFMCICACSLGDTALSYVYSGNAVRVLVAIGLHTNSIVKKLRHSFDPSHHRRVWACVWQFEKYWSFCVGRPGGLSEYVPTPMVNKQDFIYQGYGELNTFKMSAEHLRLRVTFALSLSKIHAELYNKKIDLLPMLSKIEDFSSEIDKEFFNTSDQQLTLSDISGAEFLEMEKIREWFWIRIYYLYVKLMIFRPFLIFSAYVENFKAPIPGSLKSKIEAGSNTCVDVAIELSNFIIKLNNKVRMLQPIIFISTYLESTSTVLLFYIISSLNNISEIQARKIWNVLQDTRHFLNGSYGSYLDSTKILASDGLNSLYNILKTKSNHKNETLLDKLIEPVFSDSSPMTGLSPMNFETELESYWLQTLDWINFA